MDAHEKSATQSKKFIAYMYSDTSWTVLLGLGLYRLEGLVATDGGQFVGNAGFVSVLLAMVIIKGFASVVFLGTQAALDKYVRVAALAVGKADAGPPSG